MDKQTVVAIVGIIENRIMVYRNLLNTDLSEYKDTLFKGSLSELQDLKTMLMDIAFITKY